MPSNDELRAVIAALTTERDMWRYAHQEQAPVCLELLVRVAAAEAERDEAKAMADNWCRKAYAVGYSPTKENTDA